MSKRVDRIVCVSVSVAEFSRKRGGLRAEKIVVIPNGLDVAAYDVAASQSPRARMAPPLSLPGMRSRRKRRLSSAIAAGRTAGTTHASKLSSNLLSSARTSSGGSDAAR